MPLSFPAATTVGELYKEGTKAWTWNGSAWDKVDPEEAPTGDNAPAVAVVGNTWFNTTTGKMYYYDESDMWVQVSGTPLTADQRPDFSADGHSSSAIETLSAGGTNSGQGQTRTDVNKLSFATNNDQVAHGNLASAIKYHAGATNGTSAFTIAGSNGVAVIGSVQKIEFATNTTAASHGSLSTLSHNSAATQDANQMMNAGGIYSGVRTFAIEKMAFATGSSAILHGNLTNSRSVAAAESDGYQALHISGHRGDGFGKIGNVDRYNFGYNVTAVLATTLTTPVSHHYSASDGTDIMFGGGLESNEVVTDVRKSMSFETAAVATGFGSMAAPVSWRRAASDGSQAMLTGGVGSDQTTLYSNIWRYRFSDMAETANYGSTATVQAHSLSSGGA